MIFPPQLGGKRDFGRYLAEVVAKEIPVRFVSSVTVIFKSGKRARLTKEDLSHPLPLEKNLTWDKEARLKILISL